MAGPATSLNMGMDYWGAPTSVSMHGKVIAASTSAPSSNSRDIVPSDPAIQVCYCYYAGFDSPALFFYSRTMPCTFFLGLLSVNVGRARTEETKTEAIK